MDRQSSPRQFRTLFSLVVFFVFAMALPGRVEAVVFFDEVFNDADWTAQQFLDGNFSAFQVAAGGNPDEFRQIDLSNLDTGQNIIAVDTRTGAVYDPTVSGAIASIDFSFDVNFLGGTAGTRVVGYRLALEQAGSRYFSGPGGAFLGVAQGPGNGLPGNSWDPFAFAGLTAANFVNLSGPNALDFSSTGAPIAFGYLATTGMSLPNVDNGGTSSGIDNWFVGVTPIQDGGGLGVIPEPTSMLLFGLGGLGLGVVNRRRRASHGA
jgi:hypothetical protein